MKELRFSVSYTKETLTTIQLHNTINGSRKVQHNDMSLSYRNRGNVLRISRISKTVSVTPATLVLKKITLVNQLSATIIPYSPTKMYANLVLLYSMLNPEISSDSPSAKSNGARFVSASTLTTHDGRISSIKR